VEQGDAGTHCVCQLAGKVNGVRARWAGGRADQEAIQLPRPALDDQDRRRDVLGYPQGDGAEKEAADPPPPAAADDDQVVGCRLRLLYHLLG
jgi:hypothetical protein